MKFKKFIALICTFAFIWPSFINVHAAAGDDKVVKRVKRRAKVVLVGEEEVGKTEVFKRVSDVNCGSFSKDYAPTIAAQYTSHDTQHCTFGFWDTAGQEKYRCLIPMYLRKADIVVIVIPSDMAKDDVEGYARYWKDIANESCSGTEIVLAVSKSDLETCDDTFRGAIVNATEKLGINKIFYTSAKNNDRTDEFVNGLLLIACEADKTPPSPDASVNEPPVLTPLQQALATEKETLPSPDAPVFGKKMLIAAGVGVVGIDIPNKPCIFAPSML
ncbi:MAG: GTP-binding protein [Oscillospiraceae bacterium]|jgi:small GTP-binding protein|nr:GTP-binding protein [Oscillospiraceae bacterium]